jgi:hypothetical protein
VPDDVAKGRDPRVLAIDAMRYYGQLNDLEILSPHQATDGP